MVKLAEVYKRLAPAKNNNLLAVANQSTNDIINQVLSQHSQNAIEAKKICDLFEAGNLYETSKNIWNFLKYEVPYKVEPSDKQTTKTLSRMLFDAMTGKGNDCKHYAGFTGAVLEACGYTDWRYRFAGYSKYINVPTHVYCYAKDQDGIIYIDAVINGFDLEKPFVLNIDKKINNKNMSLYKLSGIEDQQIGGLGDWLNEKKNQAAKALKQAADYAGDKARQAANYAKQEAERIAKQAQEALKTVGLAIPRNGFLLLVGQNVFNLANTMKNENFDSTRWWSTDWGGNRTDLLAAIANGKNKARIFGFNYNDVIYPSQLGMIGEPVTISSAIASSSAILAKIAPYLEKLEKAQALADKAKGVFNKGKDFYDKNKKDFDNAVDKGKKDFKNLTGVDVQNVLWKKEEGITGSKNSLSTSDVKNLTKEDAKRVGDSIVKSQGGNIGVKLDTKTMLLIGGAGIALLLILKKK